MDKMNIIICSQRNEDRNDIALNISFTLPN